MQRPHFSKETDIDERIKKLVEIRQATDPALGDASAAQKDEQAHLALSLAAHLIDLLAGWAIAHEAGKALANLNDDDDSVNDHRFESENCTVLGPIAKRRAAACLLGVLPVPYGEELQHALKALDFGEVQPMLQRNPAGKRGQAYTIAHLQLKALSHVEFRRGNGLTNTCARDLVAAAYGVESNTVKGWKLRLLPDLGKNHVAKKLQQARSHGESMLKLKAALLNDDNVLNRVNDREHIEILAKAYGDDALRRDAGNYKMALRDSPSSGA